MKQHREISSKNQIVMYLHCGQCLIELREQDLDESPMSYQRIQAGYTKQGIQIWCTRHNLNVVHLDFNDKKVHANGNCQNPAKDEKKK